MLLATPAHASRLFGGGASDYLNAAANGAYDIAISSPASFAFWVKFADTTNFQQLINKSDGAASLSDWGFFYHTDHTIYFFGSNALSNFNCSTTITDNNWHLVVYTTNGTDSAKLYVDSATACGTSASVMLATISGSQPLNIGGPGEYGVGTLKANGQIALVSIWSTELSAGNVTTLATSCSPESVGTNISAWHLYDPGDLADTGTAALGNTLTVHAGGTVTTSTNNPIVCGGGSAGTVKHRRIQ